MTSKLRHREASENRLWPFGPLLALLTSLATLVVLVGGLGVLRATANWPPHGTDGWLLGVAVLVGLVPLFLLILDPMTRSGGSIEVRGIKLVFTAVAQEQETVIVPANMAPPSGLPIADSGGASVIDALEQFAKHDAVVIDLEDGTAWWETRLAVVCAGAARLGRPRAVVFLGIERGVERAFQGWAEPYRLLRALGAANPSLRIALDDAEVIARRWQLMFAPNPAVPPPAGGPPAGGNRGTLQIFTDPDSAGVQWLMFRDGIRNEFATEQIFMSKIAPLECPTPRGISVIRLRDLFESILHVGSIDENESENAWLDAATSQQDDYLAVTRNGSYVGLLPHRALVAHVLTGFARQRQ